MSGIGDVLVLVGLFVYLFLAVLVYVFYKSRVEAG